MSVRKQADMMQAQGYLTATEAAKRLGMTPVSVYRLVERLGVKVQRAGKWVYIDARSLAATYTQAPAMQAAILVGVDAPEADENPAGAPKTPAKRPGACRARRKAKP